MDYHSLPMGSRPENAIRNNGPDELVLERLKLRELAEGWPCYRSVLSPLRSPNVIDDLYSLTFLDKAMRVNGKISLLSFTQTLWYIRLGPVAW